MISAAIGAAIVAGICVLFLHGVEKLKLWEKRMWEKRKRKEP